MKKIVKILALLAILSIGLLVVGCSSSNTSDKANKETMSKELYTCGMHPNVIQEGPGNCRYYWRTVAAHLVYGSRRSHFHPRRRRSSPEPTDL